MEGKCFLGEKLPVDSTDSMRVKNFVESALPHTVCKMNTFLHFMQKFKMAAKNGGKVIFKKIHQYTADTLWVKNFIEFTLSRTISR